MRHWIEFAAAILVVALYTGLAAPAAHANGSSGVAINGQWLTAEQLAVLQWQLGTTVAPGRYLVDPRTGCWANLDTRASGCPGGRDTHSRYGSGERSGDGSWNHWSNAAGGAVGGTADGCVYTTFGWSSC